MRPKRTTDIQSLVIRLLAMLAGIAWLGIGLANPQPTGAQAPAGISSPRDNAVVAGAVAIQGTATHSDFWKYELYYSPMAVEEWVFIGQVHETPVINGQLEIWYTNSVPDGAYRLRLRVVRRDGNYDEYFVRNISVSNTLPTVTPTPEVTPTLASTPSPLPPTPTILVEQPQVPTATPQPTMVEVAALEREVTPEAGDAAPPSSPSALSLEGLSNAVCYGGALAGGLFLLVVILALLRRLVSLLLSRL
jgi:hypothetical protein